MAASVWEFEKVHEDFRPKIGRYLAHLVGEAEAEDLTQEVFTRISRSLKTFRGECQLTTWIYRIATNVAIDRTRSYSFQRETQSAEIEQLVEYESRDLWTGLEPPSPEDRLFSRERYECFIEFIQNLPLNYRAVLVLSELEQLKNIEIAEILGLSLETVKIRLHRGRARLLQELKQHCKAEDWL